MTIELSISLLYLHVTGIQPLSAALVLTMQFAFKVCIALYAGTGLRLFIMSRRALFSLRIKEIFSYALKITLKVDTSLKKIVRSCNVLGQTCSHKIRHIQWF